MSSLAYVRSKKTWSRTTQVVDQLNQFKNATMPQLPLKFATNAEGNLVVPTRHEIPLNSAIGPSLRKRQLHAWSLFQKHFHSDIPVHDSISDVELLEHLGTSYRHVLPSLQSIQDKPHKDVFLAAQLLLMYEKPEYAPHVGPKESQAEELLFVDKVSQILAVQPKDFLGRMNDHVAKIQKHAFKHFVQEHSVTALTPNAIQQSIFCSQQASNPDLLARIQQQYNELVQPLSDLSYVPPPEVFYVDPSPMVENNQVTCKILVFDSEDL